jgi:hypothetical protein
MGLETAVMLTGAALSAGQTISGLAGANQANQAAANAANRMARTSEIDYSKNLRLPSLGINLAQQNIASQQATMNRALQEQGPAGVLGGTTAVAQQGINANLQLAAEADRMQAERNAQQIANQQAIEGRRVGREYELAGMQLQGAQNAAAQQRANVNAGLQGLLESAGGIAKMDAYNKYLGADSQKQQFLNSLMGGGMIPGNTGFSPEMSSMPSYDPNNFSFGGAFGNYMKSKV